MFTPSKPDEFWCWSVLQKVICIDPILSTFDHSWFLQWFWKDLTYHFCSTPCLIIEAIFVACSQTRYFLFNVRQAWVIKYKLQWIYWLPVQGGSSGGRRIFFLTLRPHSCVLASSMMFSKKTKRKMKQRLCTGYNFWEGAIFSQI